MTWPESPYRCLRNRRTDMNGARNAMNWFEDMWNGMRDTRLWLLGIIVALAIFNVIWALSR